MKHLPDMLPQDGYNAGFAAGKKDRINGNEFDSKPPKGHSDTYDEGYRRGYDDGGLVEENILVLIL